MIKKFCDVCLDDVNFKYEENIITKKIDDVAIEYLEKYYVCDECGSKFYDDLSDYNIHEVNKKLREKIGLITIEEINEILKKYAIGQKPLSLVLGLGEVTISRYMSGLNPSKETSSLLKEINNSPFLFELYLTKNKEKISDVAYKKALGKVSQIELASEHSKIYQCVLYILKNTFDMTPLALQKILYFIQGFSTQLLKKEMFNTVSQAWPYGPVYKDIYNCFSYYKSEHIEFNEIFSDYKFDLTVEETKLIDSILYSFGCYSGGCLIEMSHLTDPWINAREGLDSKESTSREIDFKDMKEYFKRICDEFNIKEFGDISKYAKNLFSEVQKKR